MVLDGVCSAWKRYIYVIHTFNLTFHHLKYARISNTFYSHSGQDVLSQLLKQISVLKRFLCHTILVLLLTWCAAQATRQLNVNSNTCDVIASVSWDVRSMNLDPARPLLASSYNSSLKWIHTTFEDGICMIQTMTHNLHTFFMNYYFSSIRYI